MGTKNNPGAFDCYAKAEPDEPMFILLGRDPHAADLVMLWADWRERSGEKAEVVEEARECARAMRDFGKAREARKRGEAREPMPKGFFTDEELVGKKE